MLKRSPHFCSIYRKGVDGMILGVGLDLCEISRIDRAIERPHFLERVFAPAEQVRIRAASGKRRAEIAAGMFAAKEAVSKALGTGFSGFGTVDIEITARESGQPECTLHRGALDRADRMAGEGRWRIWISVTHESGMAAATAVIEGSPSA